MSVWKLGLRAIQLLRVPEVGCQIAGLSLSGPVPPGFPERGLCILPQGQQVIADESLSSDLKREV